VSDTKLRVGMVGLGLVSTPHLKGYSTHPRAAVTAVCDLDEERARDFADEHGINEVYTSFERMIEAADIDAVDIATPTFLHGPMTQMAVQAGKHVHCEKPFCRNVAEGLAACAAARQHGVILMVGETYVFLTSHMKARSLIDDGAIGRPLQIRQRHGLWLDRPEATVYKGPPDRNWRIDPARSGGGEYPWIYDHAVHFFATAEYLTQDAPIAEIYALAAHNRTTGHVGGAAHDPYAEAEVDIPIITWKYEDPSIQGVWMRAEPLNGKHDFMRGFSTVVIGETGMIEVLGEGGHNLLWEGKQQHLILHREGEAPECYRFDEGGDDIWQSDISYYSKGHIHQVHHFVDSALSGQQPRYAGEDGLRAVRCTLAAIKSAREDRPIRIADVDATYSACQEVTA
jgi:predicted dehydrogenase